MGCDTSKSVHVVDAHVQLERKPDKSNRYTELQMDAIKSTWPLVNKDLSGNGENLFLAIFELSPQLKEIFSFGDIDRDQMVTDTSFKAHALKFMLVIRAVVENVELSQGDTFTDDVTKLLITLGAKHATFAKFQVEFFGIFKNSLIYTWGTILGEEFTSDVSDAWSKLFDDIIEHMEEGYQMYMQEKDKECVINTERSLQTSRSLETDRSVITQLLQNINTYIPDNEISKGDGSGF